MVATHGGPAGDVFLHIARVFDRTAYRGRIQVDPAQVREVQDLHRRYPIAFLPSHRSYIDPVVMASVLQRADLPPTYKLGGINVAFWPMGPMGRRAGLIFIRRSFRDDPVYKLALREYVGWLAEHRQNLEWYIEGGRTRTGKLRDPRLGLLAYLVDSVHDGRCDDFVLQPVSIVYDELLDVEEHARSATGGTKAPESLARLVSYARAQRTRYSRGDIHVAFAEPISVRDHLTRELTDAADAFAGEPDALPLQKLAFEVAVRINTVTPDHTTGAHHHGAALGRPRPHRRPAARAPHALRRLRRRPWDPGDLPPDRRAHHRAQRLVVTAASRRRHPQRPRSRGRVPDPTRATHRRGVPPQQHPALLPPPRDRRPRRVPTRCTTTRCDCATCSSSSSSSRRRASSSPRSTPRPHPPTAR